MHSHSEEQALRLPFLGRSMKVSASKVKSQWYFCYLL